MVARAIAAVAFCFLVLCASARAADDDCGDAADAMLFRVKSWRGLASYWERYPGCDDGSFGQHVSELVSTWLAQRPTTIAKLTAASERHPTLMPLVLKARARGIEMKRDW